MTILQNTHYYWAKSINIVYSKDSKASDRVYSYAAKVNIDRLGTSNNKAMFLSYLAALYNDLGDKEKALECIMEAKGLPHKEALNETINRIYDEIIK